MSVIGKLMCPAHSLPLLASASTGILTGVYAGVCLLDGPVWLQLADVKLSITSLSDVKSVLDALFYKSNGSGNGGNGESDDESVEFEVITGTGGSGQGSGQTISPAEKSKRLSAVLNVFREWWVRAESLGAVVTYSTVFIHLSMYAMTRKMPYLSMAGLLGVSELYGRVVLDPVAEGLVKLGGQNSQGSVGPLNEKQEKGVRKGLWRFYWKNSVRVVLVGSSLCLGLWGLKFGGGPRKECCK